MQIKNFSYTQALVGFFALCMAFLSGCNGGNSSDPDREKLQFSILEIQPEDQAELVPVDSVISVTFTNLVARDSVIDGNFRLECPQFVSVPAGLNVSSDERIITLTPATELPENETCTVIITNGLTDSDGQRLDSLMSWTFGTTARPETLAQGKKIFRFDTFGDEIFWTDVLKMNEVVQTAVDPVTALSVGLKVDSQALPEAVVAGILDNSIDLTSPATTVALIKLDAVVGIKGSVKEVDGVDTITRMGITCALCHSTVDDSFSEGIGKRLDGWPNRDLNPGAIIALSPALSAEQKAVYNSWGPGMYDARFNYDGINSPHVITPAYGLNGIQKITSTGDGEDIAYWNRYVAVTQMGGQGFFYDHRIGVTVQNGTQDLVSDKLPALQAYQLSLLAPEPPEGSFDSASAARGETLFNGQAQCAGCHSGPKFTDSNTRLHDPLDVVSEPEPNGAPGYASRSATKQYRTAPLEGIWQHPPYFHNGIAATLVDVVDLYDEKLNLALDNSQKEDLVEYLKSL